MPKLQMYAYNGVLAHKLTRNDQISLNLQKTWMKTFRIATHEIGICDICLNEGHKTVTLCLPEMICLLLPAVRPMLLSV